MPVPVGDVVLVLDLAGPRGSGNRGMTGEAFSCCPRGFELLKSKSNSRESDSKSVSMSCCVATGELVAGRPLKTKN